MNLINFIHQKLYEKIIYKIREDVITLVPPIIGFIFLLAVPAGLYWLILQINPGLLDSQIYFPLLVLLCALYLLSIGLFFYTYLVSYFLNLLVITNDRLLHVEQHGLFSRVISEVDLYRIQDATSEVNGIFPSLFRYGNLIIQTAGAQEKFIITRIPHPELMRQEILDLAEVDRKYHNKNLTN